MTTVANGRCTSEPGEVENAMGTNPRLGSQPVEVADNDNSIEYGDTEEGNEAYRPGEVQVHAAEPKGGYAANHGEGNVEEQEQRLGNGVERRQQQAEDDEHGGGQHDGKALHGAGLVLELATPITVVSGGQGKLRIETPLGRPPSRGWRSLSAEPSPPTVPEPPDPRRNS
jgi:hypothetical protein